MSEELITVGRVAYEAFRDSISNELWPTPGLWVTEGRNIKKAWEDAAQAVLEYAHKNSISGHLPTITSGRWSTAEKLIEERERDR